MYGFKPQATGLRVMSDDGRGSLVLRGKTFAEVRMRGLTNKPSVSGPNLIDSARNYVSQLVTVYARIMCDALTPAYFGWLPQRS